MTTAPKRSEASVAAAKPAEEKAVKGRQRQSRGSAAVKTEAPKVESSPPPGKAAEKKPAEKKPAAKRAAAPKANCGGVPGPPGSCRPTSWPARRGSGPRPSRTEAIKTMELHVKPEDGAVYCVINGESVGKFSF